MTAVVLSRHAAKRCAEFGIGLDVVATIATRPDVAHTNADGERVCTADAHPEWTVVVGDADVVVTVLRRTPDRWEHELNPSTVNRPALAARVPVDVAESPARPSAPATGERRRPAEPAARVGAVSRPVAVRRIDPAILASALDLADGDLRRLVLDPENGTVTVLNRPRGTR